MFSISGFRQVLDEKNFSIFLTKILGHEKGVSQGQKFSKKIMKNHDFQDLTQSFNDRVQSRLKNLRPRQPLKKLCVKIQLIWISVAPQINTLEILRSAILPLVYSYTRLKNPNFPLLVVGQKKVVETTFQRKCYLGDKNKLLWSFKRFLTIKAQKIILGVVWGLNPENRPYKPKFQYTRKSRF